MPKKDFKSNNPVMQFISQESVERTEAQEISKTDKNENIPQDTAEIEIKIPDGYKINPAYVETKSKRLQSLIQPSVYDKVRDIAKNKGISVNEAVNEALKKYIGGA